MIFVKQYLYFNKLKQILDFNISSNNLKVIVNETALIESLDSIE